MTKEKLNVTSTCSESDGAAAGARPDPKLGAQHLAWLRAVAEGLAPHQAAARYTWARTRARAPSRCTGPTTPLPTGCARWPAVRAIRAGT